MKNKTNNKKEMKEKELYETLLEGMRHLMEVKNYKKWMEDVEEMKYGSVFFRMYEPNKINHQNELMMMIEEQNGIHQELEKLFGNDWKNIRRKFGDDCDGVLQGIQETKNGLLNKICNTIYE